MSKRVEIINEESIDTYSPTGVDILVKGNIETDRFLRLVLKYHNPNKNRLTHAFLIDAPYPANRFILLDAVVEPKPTPETRVNAVLAFLDSGLVDFGDYDPYVNFLTPNGHYSEKVQESVDAKACIELLKEKRPELPITDYQLDAALDTMACIRKYDVLPANFGYPKILSASSLAEGNAIVKSFILNGAEVIGFVIGADIPVVLNSRSNLDMNGRAVNFLLKMERADA